MAGCRVYRDACAWVGRHAAHGIAVPLGLIRRILIGPPVVLLTSIALISGFLLLIAAPIAHWLAVPAIELTTICLRANTRMVEWADGLPGGHLYVGDVPDWWIAGFYGGLFATILLPSVRVRWRIMAVAAIAWLGIGFLPGLLRPHDDALRTTFLAVGHGGCTVFETPDGRTLLFDAGTIGGPEVTSALSLRSCGIAGFGRSTIFSSLTRTWITSMVCRHCLNDSESAEFC